MTKAELGDYRRTLLALGRRLRGDVSCLTGVAFAAPGGAGGKAAPARSDPSEWGADAYEQEVTASLLRNKGRSLEDIAAALARIEDGTYGRCEECDQAIPKGRLEALPYARHCVRCAGDLERLARSASTGRRTGTGGGRV